jgi:hypothetical protein
MNRLVGAPCMGRSRGVNITMKYNKDQWISSFEDAIVKLRPHITMRVLTTIALMAWNRFGTKDVDPSEAASEWSESMDNPA